MKYVLIIGIGIFMGGCMSPKVMTATPRVVVVSGVSSATSIDALYLAEERCEEHGRYAVHEPDNMRDGQATYRCVE